MNKSGLKTFLQSERQLKQTGSNTDHAKMSIKDRNGRDLTEAEEIKKVSRIHR